MIKSRSFSKLKRAKYLRAEKSDWREASAAAFSYTDAAGWYEIGLFCGGVNNGTVFSVCGGNSTPAA